MVSGSAPTGAGELRVPDPLARTTLAIEQNQYLDSVSNLVDRAAEPLSRDALGATLRGDWLGHALHPLLTDVPLGCWIGAGMLDALGGRSSRKAAQRLVGLGLLMVPPTVAAGLVDAKSLDDPRARRVAAVHGVGNTVVAFLYYRSWRARRRKQHFRGMLYAAAGGALAVYTGYLGGHLSFGRGVGNGLRGMDDRMLGSGSSDDSVIDIDQAAQLLDVTRDEVRRLVEGELLVPINDGGGSTDTMRFRRAEVYAARLVGA